MIQIYTVMEARASILRRANAFDFATAEASAEQKATSIRLYGEVLSAEEGVQRILRDVQQRGDGALQHWTEQLEQQKNVALSVSKQDCVASLREMDGELRQALEEAAERIRKFHAYQPLPNWRTQKLGGTLGQRATPIRRVGVYVPGGTAPLPSTLLMCAIPARVAGVEEIVVTTPPDANGCIPDVIQAAGAIAGVDEMFAVGGAQAIGALTFGTETIGRVDKIVGPGNLWVTLAKRQVYGLVGIDGLYGPTETVIVADASANASWVAADMLAQAEHDTLATAILLTPSKQIAQAVQREIGHQMESLSRAQIIERSLAGQGGIVVTEDMEQACALASEFAAEHTCIASEQPEPYLEKLRDAGGLFVGERSFEVLGDYVAGPSHVMPTGATARFASPLSVADFVKISSIIQLDPETAARLSPLAARIARAEGLDGHAAAAQQRFSADT